MPVPVDEPETSPSREGFFEAIRENLDPGSRAKIESLVTDLLKFGLQAAPLPTGVKLVFPDPAGSNAEFRLLRITNEGRARLGRLKKQLERTSSESRTGFRWMLDAIDRGDVAMVMVHDASRLSRAPLEFYEAKARDVLRS